MYGSISYAEIGYAELFPSSISFNIPLTKPIYAQTIEHTTNIAMLQQETVSLGQHPHIGFLE